MPCHFVAPPATLLRIGRFPNPFRWPPPRAAYSERAPHDLSRWDDPEGGFSTLYAATDLLGAFIETLPYFRADDDFLARLHAETDEDEPDQEVDYADSTIKPGYFTRLIGRAQIRTDVRFVDADDPRTHATLTRELPALLAEHGLQEFDRGVVMSQERIITCTIAAHLYRKFDGTDVVGIRYESRRYRRRECWAIWERDGLISEIEPDPISTAIPELQHAAKLLGLRLPAGV